MKSHGLCVLGAVAMAATPVAVNAQSSLTAAALQSGQVVASGSLRGENSPLARAIDQVLEADSPSWWGDYVANTVINAEYVYTSPDGREVHVRGDYQYKNGKRYKNDSVLVKYIDGRPSCVDYSSMGGGCKSIGDWDDTTKFWSVIGAGVGVAVVAGIAGSGSSSSPSSSKQQPQRNCDPVDSTDANGNHVMEYPCGY